MISKKFNGWLNIDKPKGITSFKVVSTIRNLLPEKRKVGHAGTLDPFATGVLPIAIGEATKVVSYALDSKKKYKFTVHWGIATDTGDVDGEVIANSEVYPSKEEILKILGQFCGKIIQVPPIFSAIKVKGKRAYELARSKKDFTLAGREVEIDSLELLWLKKDKACFEVSCGKGMYVRSLAKDIAEKLGTKGYVLELERIKSGVFSIDTAVSLDNISSHVEDNSLQNIILSLEIVLGAIPSIDFIPESAIPLMKGKKIPFVASYTSGQKLSVFSGGNLVALAKFEDGLLKPFRVFNI